MMKQRLAALIGIVSFCLLCRADQPESNALMMLKNGRNIFRFDTFGDQAFWGDTLKLHQSIEGADHGGIGRRWDGRPNRDWNVGALINLSPDLSAFTNALQVDEATVRTVLLSWGPGKFDAALLLDGKAFRPDGKSAATLIPAAFGLAGVNLHTYTGWGSIPYWNAFVANLEMHGKGNFYDPRLDDAAKFPVAARAGFGHVRNATDLITPKLAALHEYQLSLDAPTPPVGSFDGAAANRGEQVFAVNCTRCHVPPAHTEAR